MTDTPNNVNPQLLLEDQEDAEGQIRIIPMGIPENPHQQLEDIAFQLRQHIVGQNDVAANQLPNIDLPDLQTPSTPGTPLPFFAPASSRARTPASSSARTPSASGTRTPH